MVIYQALKVYGIVLMLAYLCIVQALMSPKKWCDHVHKTPEPEIIVYNRIPKCASSSVRAILDEVEDLYDNTVHYDTHRVHYWHNYDRDQKARKELYDRLKEKVNAVPESKQLIVGGHWSQHKFPKFGGRNVEYIQMVRECEDRAKSNLLFILNTCSHAVQSRKRGEYDVYLSHLLNTEIKDGDVEECLNSLSCIKNSLFWNHGKDGFMSKFLCGENCRKEEGGLVSGSMKYMSNPEVGFAAVGVTEYMAESLAMFECVYPTAFKGTEQRYREHETHSLVGRKRNATAAMKAYMEHSCSDIDSPMFEKTKEVFLERYKYMLENRGTCCRPPGTYNSTK